MTINQMHKLLAKLITDGHGRKKVCVAKSTFTHNCEGDGVTILDVAGLGIRSINVADGDGGSAQRKDGTERITTVLILAGDMGVNAKGELIAF